jgi:hypothetical protein
MRMWGYYEYQLIIAAKEPSIEDSVFVYYREIGSRVRSGGYLRRTVYYH